MPAIDTSTLRRTLIDCQIRPFGVTDQRLLGRFLETPRELFAPAGQETIAYSDMEIRHRLEGGGARSMLAPLVLARLLQEALILPTDRALDIGGATGYSAAILSGLAASVIALESDQALSRRAAENFHTLGLGNVEAVCGPLPEGVPARGPFDVVLINGAVEDRLDQLLGQLAPNGRLVALEPHAAGAGRAVLWIREGDNISERPVFDAAAQPLPEFLKAPAFAF